MEQKPDKKEASPPESSALMVFEQAIFNEQVPPQEVLDQDPVRIDISSEEQKLLPPEFVEIAQKLHQAYLYWKHCRETEQSTQPTFYRSFHEGIAHAAEAVAESETPIDPPFLLILEAKFALVTINALVMATEDYLKEGYLQDGKESIDTALSVLYEFIKTREKLEASLEATVAGIRQDIANEPESYQYASYLATQILRLQQSPLISEPKFYVLRNQLEKLGETLILLIPEDINASLSGSVGNKQIDNLMTRLLWAMVDEEVYIITMIRHGGWVWKVLFSPDGTYLATASGNKTVKLVKVAKGKEVTTLIHGGVVENISFSPDGTYLATASDDKTVKLVEVATGREVTTLIHGGVVENISFSPDGTYLATESDDKTVKLVVVATVATGTAKLVSVAMGREVTTLRHRGWVWNVSFSPDGTYLATASDDKTVKLVEVATLREVTTLRHKGRVTNVSFSPDGTYLATASDDKTAKLVEVATLREVTTIRHKGRATNVLFSPDGTYLATASWDKTAKLVEVATLREVTTLRHKGRVTKVSFSPDGTYLATESDDKTVKLLSVATGKEVTTLKHKGRLTKVSFSPDGTYLATESDDKTVKLVSVATGKEVTTLIHEGRVTKISFSPDGTYLATVLNDKTLKLINLGKLSQLINKEKTPSPTLPPPTTAIIHIEKPEAFFLAWLRTEANRYSFYEYMIKQATTAKEGLSVRYSSPILETNLLLESLGFLLLNAEKHYQTVYPTLINIKETEIRLITLQDMKQSISAALSSLYEFIVHRMDCDQETYDQALDRIQQEIEAQIANSELLLKINYKLQDLLQLEGIQQRGELQTLKEMLAVMQTLLNFLLPEAIKPQTATAPVIPIKQNLNKKEILQIIHEIEESDLIPLLSKLKSLGLLTPIVALGATGKVSDQNLLELCQFLPQTAINRPVAAAAIEKRRKTHYIGTLPPFTTINDKSTLIQLLQSAPPKTWWRR